MQCTAGRCFWDSQQLDCKILPHQAHLELPIPIRAPLSLC